MSDKVNNKQQAAMRLFGALSGVDEKYLAACEDDKGASKPGGVVVFVRKYGKAMAAVLCLAVLGAGYATMQSSNMSMDGAESVMYAPEPPNQMAAASQEAADVAESETEVMYAPEMSTQENSVTDYKEAMSDGSYKNDSFSGTTSTEAGEGGLDQSEIAGLQMPARDEEAYYQEMSLEEVQSIPVIGKYVPIDWPQGGNLEEILGHAEPGAEEIDQISLYWSAEDVPEYIFVAVSKMEGAITEEDERMLRIGHAIWAEDFTKEFLEEKLTLSSESETGTPRGQFSILYQDGDCYVKVYFYGFGEVDQVWELLQ